MSMEELKALKAKRRVIKSQCTRARTAIDAVDPQAIDVTYVKQRKEKFVGLWDKFNDVQCEIDELLATAIDIENVDELVAEQETECITFEENYFNIAGKIEHLLTNTQQPVVNDVQEQQLVNNAEQPRIAQLPTGDQGRDITQMHLPKIAIPKFGGNYEDWYPFYNTFKSIIHSNTRLTDIQKFHYLISSLEGDAAHVIKSLEITAENYTEALSLLKQRYDDKRVIAQEHIKALFDLPTVTKGNFKMLRRLIDDVLRHTRSLKSFGRPTEQWDDLVVHLIVIRLDSNIVSEWEDHVPVGVMSTLKQLTDFLTQKCKTMSVVSKKTFSDVSNPRKLNKVSNVHIATANITCAHCKERHHIYQCSNFLKLSSENRYKEAKTKRLCVNCLRSTSHQAKDCRSSTCQTCNKKHNTLLHIPDKAQKDNEASNIANQTSNSSTAILNHHITQDKYQVILSTAIINVFDRQGNSHMCKVLLDSGSQSNFITTEFATKLNLTRKIANMSDSRIKSFANAFPSYSQCTHKINSHLILAKH